MPEKTNKNIDTLLQHLGYEFKSPKILQDALTHPSLVTAGTRKKDGVAYERLEFLGDRVLGLVIAHWLYDQFPLAKEGDLAKRHAALVNRDALRHVAEIIDLGQHIHLARGAEAGKDRKNLATLADAMEAVLGALYLDGGLAVAEGFIRKYWQEDIATAETPTDSKSKLQEWAQSKGHPLPSYKLVTRSGPAHEPKFLIEVSVQGHDAVQAEGISKRAAEKEAASLLLKEIKMKDNKRDTKK